MTVFDDRERAFEAKYERDQDLEFRIAARRNRLLASWAAEHLGLSAEEAEVYRMAVVHADFEEAGDEDVIRKVLSDLEAAGCEIDEGQVRTALAEKAAEARKEILGET